MGEKTRKEIEKGRMKKNDKKKKISVELFFLNQANKGAGIA